jgi:bifunctional UDP-N-acetylglucosamine pyrophosphorylase/glucosamine-1-phosphate N-acetyltransferase
MGLSVVVLAAGEGKRFRSSTPKPLHEAAGRPLVWHVLRAAAPLGAETTVVVIGSGADRMRAALGALDGFGDIRIAHQERQLGTGDALAVAVPSLPAAGEVLVLYGDTPLLTSATLAALVDRHRAGRAAMSLVTFDGDATGYGRVLRDAGGNVTGVVEQRDATPEQLAITEANAGVYVFDRQVLDLLAKIGADNDQGEYYLPDLVPLVLAAGGRVSAVAAAEEELQGVNDRAQLAAASAVLRRRALERLMAAGVTVVDPATTYVDAEVEVGPDTVLLPMTMLEGATRIGSGCSIGPNARLTRCSVADGASVTQAVAVDATVGPEALVGPFAYLRPGAVLGPRSKVGSYVEVKNSTVGAGTKVPHLTYVGDATIGERVNVGAGTVFVNYDGSAKHHTTVEDNAFIGSATMLVAPLRVGAGAQTAAGSTITKDIPPDALAIERAEQRTLSGWAERRRRRNAARDSGQGK